MRTKNPYSISTIFNLKVIYNNQFLIFFIKFKSSLFSTKWFIIMKRKIIIFISSYCNFFFTRRNKICLFDIERLCFDKFTIPKWLLSIGPIWNIIFPAEIISFFIKGYLLNALVDSYIIFYYHYFTLKA